MRNLVFASVALAALAACGRTAPAAPDIAVTDALVRTPLGGRDVTAAYFRIANDGAADVLLTARSDISDTAELHTHVHDDGVMRMEPVESFDIPAGGALAFEPGGSHVMLFGVGEGLSQDDAAVITLVFERAGEISVAARVVDRPQDHLTPGGG